MLSLIIIAVIGFSALAYAEYEYKDTSEKIGTKVMDSSIGKNTLQYGTGEIICAGIRIVIFIIGVKIWAFLLLRLAYLL